MCLRSTLTKLCDPSSICLIKRWMSGSTIFSGILSYSKSKAFILCNFYLYLSYLMISLSSRTLEMNERIGDLIELTGVSFWISKPPPGPRFWDSFPSSFWPKTPPHGSSEITTSEIDEDKSRDKCFMDNCWFTPNLLESTCKMNYISTGLKSVSKTFILFSALASSVKTYTPEGVSMSTIDFDVTMMISRVSVMNYSNCYEYGEDVAGAKGYFWRSITLSIGRWSSGIYESFMPFSMAQAGNLECILLVKMTPRSFAMLSDALEGLGTSSQTSGSMPTAMPMATRRRVSKMMKIPSLLR